MKNKMYNKIQITYWTTQLKPFHRGQVQSDNVLKLLPDIA